MQLLKKMRNHVPSVGVLISNLYINHLKRKGMKIGDRTTIYNANSVLIDESRPWMVEIGDDVQITYGVVILTHGYDWSVLKGIHGEVIGSSGKVKIGNNVFVGVNTTILKGVTIGNNVIIGAGSLVNKDIPDNCVAAGNPARVVMSLEDYHKKRIAAQEREAKELVREYRATYGKDPDENALSEFFWLFTNEDRQLHDSWEFKMQLVGNRTLSGEKLNRNEPKYRNMRAFLDDC